MEKTLWEVLEKEFQKIIDLLYQQKTGEAYGILVPVLAQFETLLQSCEESVQQEQLIILQSALAAMEEQDATLLADILQYELVEKMNAVIG